ncbi:MAG: radical SAM protein [Ruthenibacterium lactatiformans]
MPQFHLSLQSGCDATLRRMRRIYDTAGYRAVVEKLRAAFPGASFTTDIIVGFPGETEADFEESAAFVREIGFLKVHVFSFSRRAGTPACDMPGQIDEAEKARRSHRLQAEADAVRARVIAGMEGRPVEVLLEKPVNNTLFTGYTREYVPVLLKAPGTDRAASCTRCWARSTARAAPQLWPNERRRFQSECRSPAPRISGGAFLCP